MSTTPYLVIIVGPTSAGKSEFAVQLAKKFSGEIISADSRQIYRGLDIGTGKVPGAWHATLENPTSISTPRNLTRYDLIRLKNKKGVLSKSLARYRSRTLLVFTYKSIPHYCIDFVSPRRVYTAAEYKKCAEAAIRDIASRGKLPILVGGTGFWINTVVYDLSLPPAPPDQKLRKRLEKKTAPELLKILQRLDPERAATIEQKNPRRLIRAIEIARALGRVPNLKKDTPYNILWLGLPPVYEIVSHKIELRVKSMLRRGLVAETKRLIKVRIPKQRIREFGFEYRAVLENLEGKLDRYGLESRIVRDTLAYAKRQMRWWKRNPAIRWVFSSQEAERIVRKFLQKTI